MKKKTFSINPRLGRTLMFLASLFVTFASPLTAQTENFVVSVTIGTTTTNYANIHDAVQAANTATSDVTVTLLGDVDLGAEGIAFGNIKTVGSGVDERTVKITLDLNGKTITSSELVVFIEAGTVTIIDGANSTTAGIIGATGGGISNSGTLTMSGITISGSYYGLDNESTATVTNCNIISNEDIGIKNSGVLTVNGGIVSGKKSIGIQNNQTATISGCTISGAFGITNNLNAVLTIGSGVTIKEYTEMGIPSLGSLTLYALPTFTGGNNAEGDIVLSAGYNSDDVTPYHPFQPITFGTGLTAPASPISVKVMDHDDKANDLVDAALPFAFTKGYKTAFFDSESGIVEPADVFTVSGATVEMIAGEAVAVAKDYPLVAYNTASDGSLTGLYAQDGNDITTDGAALTAAVDALAAGETLTLCKDVEDVSNCITISKGTAEAPVTIDLNGYTVTGSADGAIFSVRNVDTDDAHVVIKNGTVTATHNYTPAIFNSATAIISGVDASGYNGIQNSGTLTVTGGTFKSQDGGQGIFADADVTLTAWPTFSENNTDIVLRDGAKIVLDDGFQVPATEYSPIKVKAAGDCPITITSGYAARCKDGQNKVLDPADVFTWKGNDAYVLVLDGDEVAVKKPTELDLTVNYPEVNDGYRNFIVNGQVKYKGKDNGVANGAVDIYLNDEFKCTVNVVSEVVNDGDVLGTFRCDLGPLNAGEYTLLTHYDDVNGEFAQVDKTVNVSIYDVPAGLSTYYNNKSLRVSNVDGNGEGVKMYVVTEVSNDKVTLKEISHRTIPAYTPVIISNEGTNALNCFFEYADNDDMEALFETTFNGDLGTATLAKEFVGTAEYLENYTPDNGATLYGFNGKAFVRLAAQPDIPANRCWLEIGGDEGVNLHSAPTLKIVFDGDMTAIGDATRLNDKEQMINDSWYTLDGRKIEDGKSVNVKLPKGIYIKNGKKLIVR